MAKPTEQVTLTGKKSLGQTMMQGAKVLGGKEVPNYTLLFIDPTRNKKKGEHQTIVIPYIEIGRHGNCVVQYGDEHNAVHRKHAAILWDKGEVVIKHLGTNPLTVNGQPIAAGGQKVLQNADEIQLSQNGPRIRFNATVTKTSTMGVTQRMGLVLDQALKPYKTAVMGLTALLVGAIAFLGYQTYTFEGKLADAEKREREYKARLDKQDDEIFNLDRQKDSIDQVINDYNRDNRNTRNSIAGLIRDRDRLQQQINSLTRPAKDSDGDGVPDSRDKCPNVFGTEKDGCEKKGIPPPPPVDTDNDGVPDSRDKCPNVFGTEKDGCPGGGGNGAPLKVQNLIAAIFEDGKVNLKDFSEIKQLIELRNNGGVNSDLVKKLIEESFQDVGPLSPKTLGLLADVFDDEKLGLGDIPEVIEMMGLVISDIQDPDDDGIKGKDDKCPKEAGPKSNDGCPEPDKTKDSDGDGVPDSADKCPNEAGPAENSGCAVGGTGGDAKDTDGDGTPDNIDNCPEVRGLSTNNGCPPAAVDPNKDSDGDGIIDSQDECPCAKGKKKRKGCPKGAKGDDFNKDCIS